MSTRGCQPPQGTFLDPESWIPGCPFCSGLAWGRESGRADSSLLFMPGLLVDADGTWGWMVNCGAELGILGLLSLLP